MTTMTRRDSAVRHLDDLIEWVGDIDALRIMERTIALAKAGEPATPIMLRLNGPAYVPAPMPSQVCGERKGPVPLVPMGQPRRVDELPTPKEPKPRPVKRPANPRGAMGTIRSGKVIEVIPGRYGHPDTQRIKCVCGVEYVRQRAAGRIPGSCEACR